MTFSQPCLAPPPRLMPVVDVPLGRATSCKTVWTMLLVVYSGPTGFLAAREKDLAGVILHSPLMSGKFNPAANNMFPTTA